MQRIDATISAITKRKKQRLLFPLRHPWRWLGNNNKNEVYIASDDGEGDRRLESENNWQTKKRREEINGDEILGCFYVSLSLPVAHGARKYYPCYKSYGRVFCACKKEQRVSKLVRDYFTALIYCVITLTLPLRWTGMNRKKNSSSFSFHRFL